MSNLSESRQRAASERLLKLARPELYQNNPFRITGLPTDAGARQVRERKQRVLGALRVGAPVPAVPAELPPPTTPEPDQVRAAFDGLSDAERRLTDELFWFWGEPDGCGCPAESHQRHDAAVRAHAEVLDLELSRSATVASRKTLWREVARNWSAVWRDDLLWAHLRHRMHALADRRMDESTIDGLRTALPKALLTPLVHLASTREDKHLAAAFTGWQVGDSVLEDARTLAATPTYELLDQLLDEFGRMLDTEQPQRMPERALKELPPTLAKLERLVPHKRFRRSAATQNRAAVLMNNCALALGDLPGYRDSPLILQLLACAKKHATDPDTRATVTTNHADRSAPGNTASTGDGTDPQDLYVDALWERVPGLIEQGRYKQARNTLLTLRGLTRTDREVQDIEGLLARVDLLLAERGQATGWVGLTNVAICLVYLCAMAILLLGVFGTSQLTALIVTLVATPLPLMLVDTNLLSARPLKLGFFGGLCCFALGLVPLLLTLDSTGLTWVQALIGAACFLITLPVSIRIGRTLSDWWALR